MEFKISLDDAMMAVSAIDEMIFNLNQSISHFWQYIEESENVSFKNRTREVIDQLAARKEKYEALRTRLMRAGR